MKTLDATAALGAAALVVSAASLLSSHAPDVAVVADSQPGTPVAMQLRLAELSTGAMVILAGAVAAGLVGELWPFLVSVAAVGAAVAVYEVALRWQPAR